MILLVDDERSGTGYDIVARNAGAAIAILNSNIYIHEIWLDFDLGDNSPSGLEVAKWIVSHADTLMPIKWQIISSNPDGITRLKSEMRKADKIWDARVKKAMKKESDIS